MPCCDRPTAGTAGCLQAPDGLRSRPGRSRGPLLSAEENESSRQPGWTWKEILAGSPGPACRCDLGNTSSIAQ